MRLIFRYDSARDRLTIVPPGTDEGIVRLVSKFDSMRHIIYFFADVTMPDRPWTDWS